MCHAGATLVGWLELVWARCLGLTEEVGWLGCPEPCSYPCYHGGGGTLTRVLINLCDVKISISSSLPFGNILRLAPLYSNRSFKLWLFSCGPEHPGLVWTRGPGLSEVAGQLSCQNPVPICAVKKEGKYKPWYSPANATLRKFQQLPSHLAVSRASSFIS